MKQSEVGREWLWAQAWTFSMCTIAVLFFSGCASSNYQKADAANDSLQKAAMHIQAESRAIDVVLIALDDLVNKPAPDLKPQFTRFSTSLDRLVDASQRAEKAASAADRKSAEYLESWDKEMASIKYEAVRDQSVSRKTQVTTEFNTVSQRYRENQAVIEPLISYLQDIRTALSTDLTVGGVQSVKGLADNAGQNSRKVQMALARLSDELAASGERMSSITQQTSSARGGVGESVETTQQRAQASP